MAVATEQLARTALREQMRTERAILKVLDLAGEEFLDEALGHMRYGIHPDIAADFAELPANFDNQLEEVFEEAWLRSWAVTGSQVERGLRRWGERLWGLARRQTQLSAKSDATALLARHEAQITFAPPRDAVARYLERRIPPLRRVHSEQLKRAVRDAVAAGRIEGLPLRDIMESVKREFPQATAFRRQNIARTESSQLWNDATMARYRASGAVKGYEYLAIVDKRTTDICLWHNGQKYPLGEGETPPLHFMCRSTTVPVFWFEDVEWTTEQAPAGRYEMRRTPKTKQMRPKWIERRPLKGFGGPRALDVPNVTAADYLAEVRRLVPPDAARALLGLLDEAASAEGVAPLPKPMPTPTPTPTPAPTPAPTPTAIPEPVPQPQPPAVPVTEPPVAATAKDWAWSLSDDELHAFAYWTTPAEVEYYKKLRSASWSGKGQKWVLKSLQDIESALDRAPKYEGVVYRGLRKVSAKNFAAYEQAEIITLDSLQSGSARRDIAEWFSQRRGERSVLLEIRQPKTAIDISHATIMPREEEILLRKGSSYRVIERRVEVSPERYIKDPPLGDAFKKPEQEVLTLVLEEI